MNQTAQKSVLRFSLGTRAKIVVTKKLKTTREWYFTHLSGRPHWGDRFEFWLAGSYRRLNHPCQILWQSVQGFRSSDTPNFALLHRNSWSPLQQCKHYRATLWSKWKGPPVRHDISLIRSDVRCDLQLNLDAVQNDFLSYYILLRPLFYKSL